MNFPSRTIEQAVNEISKLPGIGRKTALRLALYMLRNPQQNTLALAHALKALVEEVVYCQVCHNISNTAVCDICASSHRNRTLICVVEDMRDVIAIENTLSYNGMYHVLGGVISPMDGVGPAQLQIKSLIDRCEQGKIREVIFALSASMEGETTVFYLYNKIKHMDLKITLIARGLGVGDELEYADELTLIKSLENRVPYISDFKL